MYKEPTYPELTFPAHYVCDGSLPDGVCRCTNLESLVLTGHLDALPSEIANLHNLTHLSICDCHLGQLPETIGLLSNLRVLELRNNHLPELPSSLGRLVQLQHLDLHANRLSTLPECIRFLGELSWLDLSENQLVRLPSGLGRLVLSTLNLRNNRMLGALPPGVFVNAVDISGCGSLTTLPNETTLLELELADSGLHELPASLRQRNVKLLWRGMEITYHIAFEPQKFTADEILKINNLELRRFMLDRMGYEAFVDQLRPTAIWTDQDRGGQRRLLRVDMRQDEPLLMLEVRCPSTGRGYLLRVPPTMQTCGQAAAWIAGFNSANEYDPIEET
jgi:hypothetical protein